MTLRLNGATSGFTEIDAPAVAGSNTLVLPGGNGSADQVISTNGSGALSFVDRGRMVRDTAKASTSGTSVDFTGIPSWVKRVTAMFSGVSTNGTSVVLVQLGAGSVTTSGYLGAASINTSATLSAAYTTGFGITQQTNAADVQHGLIILTNVSSNTWVASTSMARSDAATSQGAGSVTLSGALDRVRITTVNGTDTFDAGSINILYEG
jgi:hypothetical protein